MHTKNLYSIHKKKKIKAKKIVQNNHFLANFILLMSSLKPEVVIKYNSFSLLFVRTYNEWH